MSIVRWKNSGKSQVSESGGRCTFTGPPYPIDYSGDVRRLPTAGHYARYNATAPIEASSGPKVCHRLNPNGNRQLNHAIHIAALGQISDAVYRQLRADIDH